MSTYNKATQLHEDEVALEPWPVHGGYQMARTQWVRYPNGWEQDHWIIGDRVFPTKAEAIADWNNKESA